MDVDAHPPANRSPSGWPGRFFWRCVLGIVLAAFAIRMAASVWWQSRLETPRTFAFADSETYWSLAGTVRRGEPFQYGSPDASVFRTPGYPALLALVFTLAGSDDPPVIAARVLSALCGACATAAVIILGRRWHSPATGLVAGLMAAVHPEAISLGVFVLSEAPFHPLMALNVWCFHETFARTQPGRPRGSMGTIVSLGLATGVTAGLAALMRPSWLLFPPFVLGLKLVCDTFATLSSRMTVSHSAGHSAGYSAGYSAGHSASHVTPAPWLSAVREIATGVARPGVPVILGVCLVMAPWWWRNYQVVGEFVPTTLQVGASLYDGWRPDAEGGSDMRFAPRFFDALKREDAAGSGPFPGSFEARLDRRQREAAIAWARTHPRRVLELAGIKVARMWSPVPNARDMGGPLLRAVIAAGFIPLMALALWQTWHRRHVWPAVWLLWAPALYLTCLHSIFVSSLRYRQPALLPLMTLAAAALVEVAPRVRDAIGRWRHA
jgi:hypothetical protein